MEIKSCNVILTSLWIRATAARQFTVKERLFWREKKKKMAQDFVFFTAAGKQHITSLFFWFTYRHWCRAAVDVVSLPTNTVEIWQCDRDPGHVFSPGTFPWLHFPLHHSSSSISSKQTLLLMSETRNASLPVRHRPITHMTMSVCCT